MNKEHLIYARGVCSVMFAIALLITSLAWRVLVNS